MKKIILASIFSLGLIGCTVDTMTKAHVNVSNFDGSKEIYSQPMYVFATTGFHGAPISLGARWTEKVKDYIVVEAVVRGDYVNLASLYLNFDGEIKKYDALSSPTKLTAPNSQTLSVRSSQRGFMVPVTDIEKIRSSNSVKIKVTTLSDGYFEGVVSKDNRLSPGAKSLINVIDQIQK